MGRLLTSLFLLAFDQRGERGGYCVSGRRPCQDAKLATPGRADELLKAKWRGSGFVVRILQTLNINLLHLQHSLHNSG
jgi:hypothetical protein